MTIYEIFQTLNACHGPSGDEGGIRDAIQTMAKPYADEISADTMGNLIVRRKGTGAKVMLCAHMDSIGLVVTHFEKDGYIRVGRLGGVDAGEVVYTTTRFKNGVVGAVVKEEKTELGKLKVDDLLLDIGADCEESARGLVQLGDTAVCDLESKIMNGCKVVSPYLDNRICCALLLWALMEISHCENDMYFVFSAQEEVGLRGAKTAAYAIAPDYGIAVDVTTTDDVPGSALDGTTQLGKGAAIKVMDSSVICSPKVVAKLEEIAKTADIPTQRDIMKGGGTDSGAMSTAGLGVLTGGISVPCRYIHTPVETADLGDVTACAKLVIALAKTKLEEV